jgi:hypothetical protein
MDPPPSHDFEPNYMSGEYLRPDLHLAPCSVTQLTQRTSPRSTYQSLATATLSTRPLADFGNPGLLPMRGK